MDLAKLLKLLFKNNSPPLTFSLISLLPPGQSEDKIILELFNASMVALQHPSNNDAQI